MDDDRKVLLELLMQMCVEARTSGRHYVEQRSSVATILASVAAALLAVVGALWGSRGEIGQGLSLIAASIAVIGLLGLTLTIKLFERHMVTFKVGDAYADAERLVPGTEEVSYVPGTEGRLAFSAEPWSAW